MSPGDKITIRSPLYHQHTEEDIDGDRIKRVVTLTRSSDVSTYPKSIQAIYFKRLNRKNGFPYKIVQTNDGDWIPFDQVKIKFEEQLKKESKMKKESKLTQLIKKLVKEEASAWDSSMEKRSANSNVYLRYPYTVLIKLYTPGMSKAELYKSVQEKYKSSFDKDNTPPHDYKYNIEFLQMDINKFYKDLKLLDTAMDTLSSASDKLNDLLSDLKSGKRIIGVKSLASVRKFSDAMDTLNSTLKTKK